MPAKKRLDKKKTYGAGKTTPVRTRSLCPEEASVQILIIHWANNHTCGAAAEFASYWIESGTAVRRRVRRFDAGSHHHCIDCPGCVNAVIIGREKKTFSVHRTTGDAGCG